MKKIYVLAIISFLFSPVFAGAVSDQPVVTTILAKPSQEQYAWSAKAEMASGQNFDFLVVIKNDSSDPIQETEVDIKVPEELLYKGYIELNGIRKNVDIELPFDIGAFLPGEEKSLLFEAKSKTLSFEQKEANLSVKTIADNRIYYSSMNITLKPYSFAGLASIGSLGLAAISFFVTKWYFWLFIFILIIAYFYKEFFHLFSTPRS